MSKKRNHFKNDDANEASLVDQTIVDPSPEEAPIDEKPEASDKVASWSDLVAKYDKFKITNRTDTTQTIALSNGEELQIMANTTAAVESSLVASIPDFQKFRLVVPSLMELMEAGLIKKKA